MEDLLALNFTICQIARILNVGRTTLYKKMQEYGILYDRYSHISDERLREVIEDIQRVHRDMGEVMIMGHLRSRHINVQRHRVRLVLGQIDPEGIRTSSRPIQHRTYDVPCPNYMWHIDGTTS